MEAREREYGQVRDEGEGSKWQGRRLGKDHSGGGQSGRGKS